MRINSKNIVFPTQSAYEFSDGELHSDPAALTTYLAGQLQPIRSRAANRANSYTRSYEKSQRTTRMARAAERARKDRQRRGED